MSLVDCCKESQSEAYDTLPMGASDQTSELIDLNFVSELGQVKRTSVNDVLGH